MQIVVTLSFELGKLESSAPIEEELQKKVPCFSLSAQSKK